MKVLVVGKGRSESPLKVAGHELQFIETPKNGGKIPSLADFSLALFHLSDDGHPFAPVLDTWKNAGEISKVIAVSGGTSLSRDEEQRLNDLGHIQFIGNIADMNSVKRLRWNAIAGDSAESAANLAKWLVQATSHLVALDILCQGFEIAHREERGAGRVLSEEQVKATESTEWWTRCLNVSGLDDLRNRLEEEKVAGPLIDKIETGFQLARRQESLLSGALRVRKAVKEALE